MLACQQVTRPHCIFFFISSVYAEVCTSMLNKYFEQLCNISDLDSLLPYFEDREIITVHQHVEIENSNSTTEDKMKLLIDNIDLPLQNGSTERFDVMIEIFIDHGVRETKLMATLMRREVKGTNYFNVVMIMNSSFCIPTCCLYIKDDL